MTTLRYSPPVALFAGLLALAMAGCGADTVNVPPEEEGVAFADPQLESRTRQVLLKFRGEGALTEGDLLQLTDLTIGTWGVSDLTGIEHCHRLVTLDVSGNEITEMAPLAETVPLRKLDAADNHIASLRPLDRLRELYELDVSNNRVGSLLGV